MGMTINEAEFGAASMAQWTDMARRILKGAAPDSLDRIDEDGLVTAALYPVASDDTTTQFLPADPARRLTAGWHVCQPMPGDATSAQCRAVLENGATALLLRTADTGALAAQLEGVVLPAIGIGFEGDAATPDHYHTLMALASERGDDAGLLDIDLGLDPLHALAAGLALHAEAPAAHRLFRVDGWSWHNRGLTAAQELGLITAGLAAMLRGADSAGLNAGDIASRASVRLALPADSFAGVAACRAMRRLWDGLLSACGIAPTPLVLGGYASLRMMSLLDAEVNMLRTTTALLGGAIGGADLMTGFGHDLLTGESDAGQRTARLVQVMMMAESGLSASLDPASGSPFIEQRTEDLATAGWAAFQAIEAAGGLADAIDSGMIEDQAEAASARREQRLRAGDSDLLGVTLQPVAGPVPDANAEFAGISRPAAIVEHLRRTALASPPRLLILRGASDSAAGEERSMRRLLAMAGLQPVILGADEAEAITAARPDVVIGCGMTAVPHGLAAGSFRAAASILDSGDRLGCLEEMIGSKGGTG